MKMIELFYNHPTKQWHFEQLLKETGLSRAQTNTWLKKLQKDHLIIRIKELQKMLYYLANHQHPHYQNSKHLYGLEQLHQSGLLDYLASQEKAQTIILFGSLSRSDWYNESDIDIFIYGNVEQIYVGKFLPKLKREIQMFTAKNEEDLKKMGSALLRNIIKGITLKGTLPKEVLSYAAI